MLYALRVLGYDQGFLEVIRCYLFKTSYVPFFLNMLFKVSSDT